MQFKPTKREQLFVVRRPGGIANSVNVWAFLFGAFVTTGFSQTNQLALELQSPDPGIWRNGIGNGFKEGTVQAGFSVGGGFGWAAFGSRVAHDLTLASVNVGRVTSDLVAQDHWFRGNWELAGELFGGAQFSPEYRWIVGLTPLVRYNLATGTRWVPFANAGAGVTATDIGRPDLGTTLQFDPQVGLGMHCFLREDLAVTLDYRWLHLSNAGIRQPNHGVNTQMFCVGINWFF
jgi:opacity protein-like surface antigen